MEHAPRAGRAGEKKDGWRRRMRALRRALPPRRSQGLSRLLSRRLEGLLAALGAGRIGVYAAVRGEADLSALWEAGNGRAFYFPRVEGDRMTFCAVEDPRRDLEPGAFGIPAPAAGAPPAPPGALDVVLAPGLAFDLFGGRIGSGRGFYDRFLGSCAEHLPVVGVGFAFQLVWDSPLPAEPGDGLVNWVVTDREAVRCLPRRYALGGEDEHAGLA